MKLSTRSRYGTRLMLNMAANYGQGVTRLAEIADKQGISLKYLEQIIIPLKKAAYVKSVRGGKGGHMLAKPPADITVGEIVALLEGGACFTKCAEDPSACERSEECLTRSLWQDAADVMFAKLNEVTLADLLKDAPKSSVLSGPDCK